MFKVNNKDTRTTLTLKRFPYGFSNNVSSRVRVKPWFFVTFNIIICHIFPCYKETNASVYYEWCQHLFYSQPTLNRLFNNYIKSYRYLIGSSWNMKRGLNWPSRRNYSQKAQPFSVTTKKVLIITFIL